MSRHFLTSQDLSYANKPTLYFRSMESISNLDTVLSRIKSMVTTIQRWGNSLAVRIPKAFAAQAQLTENSDVDISLDGGRIVVTPARREWKLDDLVRSIKRSNRHREIRWGD